MQRLTLLEWGCTHDNDSKVVVGQPYRSQKTFLTIVVKNNVSYWYLVSWTFFFVLTLYPWKNYNFHWKVLELFLELLLYIVSFLPRLLTLSVMEFSYSVQFVLINATPIEWKFSLSCLTQSFFPLRHKPPISGNWTLPGRKHCVSNSEHISGIRSDLVR